MLGDGAMFQSSVLLKGRLISLLYRKRHLSLTIRRKEGEEEVEEMRPSGSDGPKIPDRSHSAYSAHTA